MNEILQKLDQAISIVYEESGGADWATEIAIILTECKTQLEQYQKQS